MSGFYNAVIRDNLKILARTHLTDPKHVPWWWEIRDWSGEEIVSGAGLEKRLIDPQRPLQIRKRKVIRMPAESDTDFEVIFPFKTRDTEEEEVRLKVHSWNTVQDLFWMVSREKGVKTHEFLAWNPVLNGTELWDKMEWTLERLGVNQENNRFEYIVPAKKKRYDRPIKGNSGGGGFGWAWSGRRRRLEFANLEGTRVSDVGELAKESDYWKSFAPGLNLLGDCSNPQCLSQNFKDSVIVNLGFKALRLTPSSTFDCRACEETKSVKPTNFLLSGARAAFQYKLTGDRVLKWVTLGTDGSFPKYVTMKEGEEEDKRDYDYIRIRVVHWKSSPHDCVICLKPIRTRDEERSSELEECQHYWHDNCNDDEIDCPICLATTGMEIGIRNICL